MSYKLITGPAGYPVTVDEARDWVGLRSGNTSHDTKLALLISGATEWVESVTGIDLVERTWNIRFDRFPFGNGDIEISKYPVQEIISITYIDDLTASPQTDTVATSVFALDEGLTPSIVYLKPNQSWPSAVCAHNSVTVQFKSGYAPSESSSPVDHGANVPSDLKIAILMVVADCFEHREANLDFKTYENKAVEAMLAAKRIIEL